MSVTVLKWGVNGATAFGTVALDGSNTIPVAANVNVSVSKSKVPATATAGEKLKGSLLLTISNTGNLAAASRSITVYAGGVWYRFHHVGGSSDAEDDHARKHAGGGLRAQDPDQLHRRGAGGPVTTWLPS